MTKHILFVIVFVVLGILSPSMVWAETIPGTNYSIHFESAFIVGAGRNINVYRLPVVNVLTNEVALYDVYFEFVDRKIELTPDRHLKLTS